MTRLWFVDTSSLISIAASRDIKKVVEEAVGSDSILHLDVVADELDHRARVDGPSSLAAVARKDSDWLGEAVASGRYWTESEVLDIQDEIAAGRALRDPFEHWAESVTIAMMENGSASVTKMFLTEDYSARVRAARAPGCRPLSLHRLFYELVAIEAMSATQAEHLADLLQKAGRAAAAYTADEFSHPTTKKLGRVGYP